MLRTSSLLEPSHLSSALAGQSRIKPSGGRHGRVVVASLMLTSLVDAFSILVIFLIMNHAADQEMLNIGDKLTLPKASASQLIQKGVVIRLENGKVHLDDAVVSLGSLADQLKAVSTSDKENGLIIVADRSLDYAELSPIILMGSSAGFTKYKFAVIQKD